MEIISKKIRVQKYSDGSTKYIVDFCVKEYKKFLGFSYVRKKWLRIKENPLFLSPMIDDYGTYFPFSYIEDIEPALLKLIEKQKERELLPKVEKIFDL